MSSHRYSEIFLLITRMAFGKEVAFLRHPQTELLHQTATSIYNAILALCPGALSPSDRILYASSAKSHSSILLELCTHHSYLSFRMYLRAACSYVYPFVGGILHLSVGYFEVRP